LGVEAADAPFDAAGVEPAEVIGSALGDGIELAIDFDAVLVVAPGIDLPSPLPSKKRRNGWPLASRRSQPLLLGTVPWTSLTVQFFSSSGVEW